jgi:hypothetical protein
MIMTGLLQTSDGLGIPGIHAISYRQTAWPCFGFLFYTFMRPSTLGMHNVLSSYS